MTDPRTPAEHAERLAMEIVPFPSGTEHWRVRRLLEEALSDYAASVRREVVEECLAMCRKFGEGAESASRLRHANQIEAAIRALFQETKASVISRGPRGRSANDERSLCIDCNKAKVVS